jgi:hypothetical protein
VNDLPRREDGTLDVLALLRESTPLLSNRELPPTAEELRDHEAECTRRSSRVWAAMMLTESVAVFESILRGDAVLVRQLDAAMLRRALRGRRLRDSEEEAYLVVSDDMLDAIAEAGSR